MERDLALAELALKWNVVTQKDLLGCLKEQGRAGDSERSLGQILVDKGFLSPAELRSLIRELSHGLVYDRGASGETNVLCPECGSVYALPRPIPKGFKCETCKTDLTRRRRPPRAESVTRLDLVRAVHDGSGSKEMTLARAGELVDLILDSIGAALAAGRRVEVRRLGSFEPVGRAPRTARNPRTGEPVQVPYRSSVRFKASKELLKRLKGGKKS